MKKKLLTTILLFSVLLGGCGNSGNSSPTVVDNVDTWEDDSEYEEMDTDYEEDTYEEPEEVVVETYPFTKLHPFSEERAWVNFNKDGIVYTGIIDTEGEVLYQAEGEFFYVSQFLDGTAFYRENSGETSPCGIIDLDGNVLFESQIIPDGGYLILAYGNGHFFAAQHIQNFDTEEWRYGTIDNKGKILNEFVENRYIQHDDLIDYTIDYEMEYWYIGENFIQTPIGLYNVATGHFNIYAIATGSFYEGYTVLYRKASDASVEAYVIDTSYQADLEERYFEGRYRLDEKAAGIYSESGSIRIRRLSGYSEGLILGSDGYYDKDWNLVVSLEKYCDKEIKGGPFGNGYAAVTLKGADNCQYASVVDQSGNLAYDPIKVDSGELNDSANGYFQVIIDGTKKIIGLDGTIYTPGIDDLSLLEGLTFGDVSEGFILMNQEDGSETSPYYVNLDTNTIIDTAKVASTDTDIDGDESWDDEALGDTSYIVPDSYDITGKWKSVGESGFGQAQPGAIVVFDGNNCNFYSPNDTYAFYKEDDRYVLDITSVLGESLSQTVNIIDDDNIEIAGANLKRME